jgi:hypothetical protein
MAEATYMHVWSSNHGTKKRYWIGYFFIGFGKTFLKQTNYLKRNVINTTYIKLR